MIPDLTIGGVFLPGLLVLAIVALAGTVAVLRLLSRFGLARLFGFRPLLEIATFASLYGLLVQFFLSTGILP